MDIQELTDDLNHVNGLIRDCRPKSGYDYAYRCLFVQRYIFEKIILEKDPGMIQSRKYMSYETLISQAKRFIELANNTLDSCDSESFSHQAGNFETDAHNKLCEELNQIVKDKGGTFEKAAQWIAQIHELDFFEVVKLKNNIVIKC